MPDGLRFDQALGLANVAVCEVRDDQSRRKKEHARREAGHVVVSPKVGRSDHLK
jgi:hypothetical protein